MIDTPLTAPVPLIYPDKDMLALQAKLFNILQSTVAFNLKVNSPSIFEGFAGRGKAPISHINVPLAPCVGSNVRVFGVGTGV